MWLKVIFDLHPAPPAALLDHFSNFSRKQQANLPSTDMTVSRELSMLIQKVCFYSWTLNETQKDEVSLSLQSVYFPFSCCELLTLANAQH